MNYLILPACAKPELCFGEVRLMLLILFLICLLLIAFAIIVTINWLLTTLQNFIYKFLTGTDIEE